MDQERLAAGAYASVCNLRPFGAVGRDLCQIETGSSKLPG
jgi:hypothetical protein